MTPSVKHQGHWRNITYSSQLDLGKKNCLININLLGLKKKVLLNRIYVHFQIKQKIFLDTFLAADTDTTTTITYYYYVLTNIW